MTDLSQLVQIAALEKRIAALESALSPFAKVGAHASDPKTPFQVFTWGSAPSLPKQVWIDAARTLGLSPISESDSKEVKSHE